MLELKDTQHSYYCSECNYYCDGYANWGRNDYDTWKDFKDEWFIDGWENELDDDLNHLFRFDISHDDETGNFELFLFFILQRKGIFRPVIIHSIAQEDMPEIEEFLMHRWQYLKYQWKEFSKEE